MLKYLLARRPDLTGIRHPVSAEKEEARIEVRILALNSPHKNSAPFLREEEGRRSGVGGYLRVERRFSMSERFSFLDCNLLYPGIY